MTGRLLAAFSLTSKHLHLELNEQLAPRGFGVT